MIANSAQFIWPELVLCHTQQGWRMRQIRLRWKFSMPRQNAFRYMINTMWINDIIFPCTNLARCCKICSHFLCMNPWWILQVGALLNHLLNHLFPGVRSFWIWSMIMIMVIIKQYDNHPYLFIVESSQSMLLHPAWHGIHAMIWGVTEGQTAITWKGNLTYSGGKRVDFFFKAHFGENSVPN